MVVAFGFDLDNSLDKHVVDDAFTSFSPRENPCCDMLLGKKEAEYHCMQNDDEFVQCLLDIKKGIDLFCE